MGVECKGEDDKYVWILTDEERPKPVLPEVVRRILEKLPRDDMPDLISLDTIRPLGTEFMDLGWLEDGAKLLKVPKFRRHGLNGPHDISSMGGSERRMNHGLSSYLLRCGGAKRLLKQVGNFQGYDGASTALDSHLFDAASSLEFEGSMMVLAPTDV